MPRGRKSGAILWRPDVIEERGPIFVQRLQNQPMGEILRYVSTLPDELDSRLQIVSDVFLRWAIADVVRRRWVPSMKVAIASRKTKLKAIDKKLIQAEGLVLSRLLDIALDVFLLNNSGYADAAYWWFDCCREPSAHRITSLELDSNSPRKMDARSEYEGITAALRRREANPFQNGPSRKLFNTAIKLSEESTGKKADSEHFYSKRYLPYLEARADLAKIIRDKSAKIVGEFALNLNNPYRPVVSASKILADEVP